MIKTKKTANLLKATNLFLALVIIFSFFSALPKAQAITGVPAHLIINQFYGGNYSYNPSTGLEDAVTGTPISHSFIELYNPTTSAVNLSG